MFGEKKKKKSKDAEPAEEEAVFGDKKKKKKDKKDESEEEGDFGAMFGKKKKKKEEKKEEAAPKSGLLVCELRSMLPIPNKDKLRLATVCIGGDRTEEVVTNVVSMVPGRNYLVAIADCTIHGGEVRRQKVGGVESAGMFCGPKELGWSHPLLSTKEPIMVPAR